MKVADHEVAAPDPFGYASAPSADAADLREAEAAKARRRTRRPAVPCTAIVSADGKVHLRSTVSDEAVFVHRLFDTCGSESGEWVTLLFAQLARVGEGQAAAGIAFLNGVAPADEVEAALAAQMFAVHGLVMAAASRAKADHQEAVEQVIRLGALFTSQVDALGKLRAQALTGSTPPNSRAAWSDERGDGS